MAAEKSIRATVARGRTVWADHPTEKRPIFNSEGKPSQGPKPHLFLPGQEVELPEADVMRLRALGHLVDPKALEAQFGSGPDFGPGPKRIDAGE